MTSCAYPPDASGHVNVPEGVTSIGYQAFSGCEALRSITFPSTLTRIDSWAFTYRQLAALEFPESLEQVASNAFYGVRDVSSVTLPSKCLSLGSGAFTQMPDLTSFTFPSTFENVPPWCFFNSKKLATVNFPSSLKSVGDSAFGGTALGLSILPVGCTVGTNAFAGTGGYTFAVPSPPTPASPLPSSPPPNDGALVELTGIEPKIRFGDADAPTCELSLDRINARLVSTCPIANGGRRLAEEEPNWKEELVALKASIAEIRGQLAAMGSMNS